MRTGGLLFAFISTKPPDNELTFKTPDEVLDFVKRLKKKD
jgi:hypothetical protein